MTSAPLLSIVMPVFNDESTVAASIESALAQTLHEIEIICVDDASTDGTAAVVERIAARDPRVHLIRHERNLSAFQGRRSGIFAAAGRHVMFLDGDDELVPDAAQTALTHAVSTGADVLGFGVTVVTRDGRVGGGYERRLQPQHRHLEGVEVLTGLFPIGKPAQGQLWRYLFTTEILRRAYGLLDEDLTLARVNDLPLMFLVAALAARYDSIDERLYRYHYGRGGSGHRVDSVERARFYTSAITSIDSIRDAVRGLAEEHPRSTLLLDSYESARLSIIGHVCFQLIERSDSALLDAALAHLHAVTSGHDIVHAAAKFYPGTLATLKFHAEWQGLPENDVRSVLLATSTVRTGGVSAVLASQARYLRDAGFRVTAVARKAGSDPTALPEGVPLVELTAPTHVERLEEWAKVCRENEVDLVIDHQVLYSDEWPEYALMSRAEGAPTIGWVHNFVGRPIYDGSERLSLIQRCSNTLARLVVLSPLDTAYFKLRGVEHTSYLPNPPSPLLVESTAIRPTRRAPRDRIELVWWGRLDQHTKQVLELIEIGVELKRLAVDFRLTVIGPDWNRLTAKKFNDEARRRGVGDGVVAVGPLHGPRLIDAIDAADAFVTTSVIEGYQLTIAEAQARGLPVFMYDLPWLTLVHDNAGVIAVPQGEARTLAAEIADVAGAPDRYELMSLASLDAAQRAVAYDFADLYQALVSDTLPTEYSPPPSLDDAEMLLGLMVFYAERSHRSDRGTASGPTALGRRAWRRAAPLGRSALARFPALRPLARRAKRWLGVS